MVEQTGSFGRMSHFIIISKSKIQGTISVFSDRDLFLDENKK